VETALHHPCAFIEENDQRTGRDQHNDHGGDLKLKYESSFLDAISLAELIHSKSGGGRAGPVWSDSLVAW
jgi:hypothetical protein